MKFNRIIFILLLAFLSLTTFVMAQESVNKTLPDITIKNLEDEAVNMQKYAKDGKITVISFWATWCVPCKKELNTIAEVYPKWQEDYDMELVAITIDNARSLRKVKPMVEAKGWKYTILSDADETLKTSLGFQTVPMTFLLDQGGNIVYEHSGYAIGDEIELENKIKALAAKK
jgi:Peroxiredoxin